MGLRIQLAFHQREDIKFDDINALNEELIADTSFGELYDSLDTSYAKEEEFNGPFMEKDGELKIANNGDGYFEGYDNYTDVWGCYGDDVWKTIAKHLTEGKIVFHLDIEGNPDQYIIITPDSVEVKEETELKF